MTTSTHNNPAQAHKPARDFSVFLDALGRVPANAQLDERMRALCDAAWTCFGNTTPGEGRNVSWIGFYAIDQSAAEMVLTHRRNKPACSPIGLQGACGQSWSSKQILVITDVARLGNGYIACDPMDKAELVIPIFDMHGSCTGVLDADSYDAGAFSEHDAREMHSALLASKVTYGTLPPVRIV